MVTPLYLGFTVITKGGYTTECYGMIGSIYSFYTVSTININCVCNNIMIDIMAEIVYQFVFVGYVFQFIFVML